jgi:hypothetical protein
MTLIIKELIIKGEVLEDNSVFEGRGIEEERLKEYLSQLKKEMENDCFDRIMEKLQNQSKR